MTSESVTTRHSRFLERWIVAGLVAVGLLLRIWGINHGLPYIYHPDEPRYVMSAQLLFQTHDLDPRSLPKLSSSSLVYVVNALAYVPYYLIGKWMGMFSTPLDIPAPTMLTLGVGKTLMPSTFLLNRMVTVLFGLATIVLVYLTGRRLFKNPAVGILAAAIMAIAPGNIDNSRWVTPDTFLTFFMLLAFYGTLCIYQDDRRRYYILTGLALGCVVSSKISGLLILLPLAVAYFYRKGVKGVLNPDLIWMGVSAGLAFVATTPYVLGNVKDVLGDILYEGRHYASGHAGMEGGSLAWYLGYMWQTGGVIYILAALEILRGIYLRSKELIWLSIFPVVYFTFISSFVVRNDRTFLPLTPFMFLLAASFAVHLFDRVKAGLKARRVVFASAMACLVVASLIQPISRLIADATQLTAVDGREPARVWIAENLPSGAKIAIEAYSPYVEPARFDVLALGMMIEHEPAWYIDQGFDYLVFGQNMFGRFYQEPERYRAEVAQYDDLFARFEPVMLFDQGGYEVRIYRVSAEK